MFKVLSKRYSQREVVFTGVEIRRLLGPDGVFLPDESQGDTLVYINFGRAAVAGSSTFFPDYPASETAGTPGDSGSTTELARSSSYDWVNNGGGLSSGITPNGTGGNSPARRFGNTNTNPLHERYTASSGNDFYIELWVYEMERLASNAAMLYGVPHDTFGAKLEFGIDSSNRVYLYLQDGADSITVNGSTNLGNPFTGQIFAYFRQGNEVVVGYNGIEDGSGSPPVGITNIHGGTSFARRAFFFNRNSGASVQNPVQDTSIISRAYLYAIGSSRFPGDASATIAAHNYAVLNGTF
jgi:hypothetical protein